MLKLDALGVQLLQQNRREGIKREKKRINEIPLYLSPPIPFWERERNWRRDIWGDGKERRNSAGSRFVGISTWS